MIKEGDLVTVVKFVDHGDTGYNAPLKLMGQTLKVSDIRDINEPYTIRVSVPSILEYGKAHEDFALEELELVYEF